MTTIQITPRPPDPNPPAPSTSGGPIAFAEAGYHFKLTSAWRMHALADPVELS